MNDLLKIREEFTQRLKEITTAEELQTLRREYLGKNSVISNLMQQIRDLPVEEKKNFGDKVNEMKEYFVNNIDEIFKRIEKLMLLQKMAKETIDPTLPGINYKPGIKNPYWQTYDELLRIFTSMGFEVYEGSEVESDYFNFTALNTPEDHPAREMQDSFYLKEAGLLLRSHTSAAQGHKLKENQNDIIKIVTPGKAYRRDYDDMTHSHQFSQMECLVIGQNVHMGHLKNTLETFLEKLFKKKLKIRLRSSYFPFTEPSVEVDMTCFKCGGSGCSLCKNTGYIEILGAGMVHPNVLKIAGFDTEKYQGFAFGVGIERLAMLRYGIDDIRRIYQNDLRFIHQFKKKVG